MILLMNAKYWRGGSKCRFSGYFFLNHEPGTLNPTKMQKSNETHFNPFLPVRSGWSFFVGAGVDPSRGSMNGNGTKNPCHKIVEESSRWIFILAARFSPSFRNSPSKK